jgi:hypothetical protein
MQSCQETFSLVPRPILLRSIFRQPNVQQRTKLAYRIYHRCLPVRKQNMFFASISSAARGTYVQLGNYFSLLMRLVNVCVRNGDRSWSLSDILTICPHIVVLEADERQTTSI